LEIRSNVLAACHAALLVAAATFIIIVAGCAKAPAAMTTPYTPPAATVPEVTTPAPTTTLPVKTTTAPPQRLTILSIQGGNVDVLKKGAAEWKSAAEGMTLDAGDKVRTDAGGKALITFFEGSTVELEDSTAVTLAELGINADQSTTVKIRQEMGETLSRAKKLMDTADRYEVETPVAVAAVRGTVMYVRVANDGATFVGNVEGAVAVTAQGKTVALPEATHTSVAPGQPPAVPEPGAMPGAPVEKPAPATTPPTTPTTTAPPQSPPPATTTTTVQHQLSIAITSLRQGDVVGRTVVVTGTVSDPTITQGTYTLNGVQGTMPVSQGTFSFTISLADGTNYLTVSVTKNGATATASVQLVPEQR
jgi:hypothetical protein